MALSRVTSYVTAAAGGVAWTDLDPAASDGTIRVGAGSGNQIDSTASDVSAAPYSIVTGTVAAVADTAPAGYYWDVTFTEPGDVAIVARLACTLPTGAYRKGLGFAITDATVTDPTTGSKGQAGWFFATNADDERLQAIQIGTAITGSPISASANDVEALQVVFSISGDRARSVVCQGLGPSSAHRGTDEYGVNSSGMTISGATVRLWLLVEDSDTSAHTFTVSELQYAVLAWPT